ncbi:lycopene cyclase domain-containing protein [Zafaria sp. Z1313]|uniref:lycopene cyclase domain-containing protein n=1 Tax=unclassified Zafaria TaxID=2828765 RepID=UPI002E76D5B7|nr:lycopene cyclase domain-containing protein [Zafaria sp. J156]MEE1620943.1 lycopene cyclase domain-containing protein [Zafaria sp. J156]
MTYLLILLGLLACMTALDARYRLFLFRAPLPALAALAVGTAVLLAWDAWAIAEGIFLHRDSVWMTGIMLADQLPLEEAFFLVFLCYQSMVLVAGLQAVLAARGRDGGRA